MVKKSLIDYVRNLVQKGYDISAIRNILLKYGYAGSEIDEAIKASFNPTVKHVIHLSHTTALVIIFVFASLLGVSSIYYYGSSRAPAKLLDLNLEPITTTAEPGQPVIFLKELSNLGSSKRYDVEITQEIISKATSRSITQKTETRAIETFGSTQTKMLVPDDAKAGDYILRVIVEYDNKKAVATLPIRIIASSKKETCFDGINNQDEGGIDCGGMCRQCEEQALECDDSNQCTSDSIEGNECINNPIEPCCGNSICEEQEESCAADCKKAEYPSFSSGTLDEIKELAKANPSKALQQCNQLEVPEQKDECIANIGEVQRNKNYCTQIINARTKDLCFLNIAKAINDDSLCEEVSIDSRKDSCYMTFVLDNKDYSVCDKITNSHLRQSCESLRQLNEMNQESQAQS